MSDTAKNIISDSNADSGERLIEMMTLRGTTFRDQLIDAARKAGEQLEWWKPIVFIPHPNPRTRLHVGSIVPADPGTVLIVLANADRTLTLRLLPPPSKVARREMIDDVAAAAQQHYGEDRGWFDKGEIIPVMNAAVENWGGQPGTKTGEMPENAGMNLIGLLFAAMSADKRESLLDLMEAVIDRGFCPAMVGLVGKGTERGLCGIWPLVLPLAQYFDAAEQALGNKEQAT
jgi:hypothetical protein